MGAKRRLGLVLPEMKCDDGCGACCGPAPLSESEYQRIKAYIVEHKIALDLTKTDMVTCPLYIGGKCAVYEVRPRVCKAFGHSKYMRCPRGYNVNVDDRDLRDYVFAEGKPTRTTWDFRP